MINRTLSRMEHSQATIYVGDKCAHYSNFTSCTCKVYLLHVIPNEVSKATVSWLGVGIPFQLRITVPLGPSSHSDYGLLEISGLCSLSTCTELPLWFSHQLWGIFIPGECYTLQPWVQNVKENASTEWLPSFFPPTFITSSTWKQLLTSYMLRWSQTCIFAFYNRLHKYSSFLLSLPCSCNYMVRTLQTIF